MYICLAAAVSRNWATCKNPAMNPAHGDAGDVIDALRVRISRNLLQAMGSSKNPAYRPARRFFNVLDVLETGSSGAHSWRVDSSRVQAGNQKSLYTPRNIFPFALKAHPCRCLHFSNNPGLFFSSSRAEATTSAVGSFRSAATQKHVDRSRDETTRTNRESTRNSRCPAVSR